LELLVSAVFMAFGTPKYLAQCIQTDINYYIAKGTNRETHLKKPWAAIVILYFFENSVVILEVDIIKKYKGR
jgi:hypothetical protein